MKHSKILVVIIVSLIQGFSQRIFIEPDLGIYKPLNWSRLDSLVISSEQREQEFNFDFSPRYGAKIGIVFPTDNKIFIGYKTWSNKQSNTKLNTIVLGMSTDVFLVDSDIGMRLGAELISGTMSNELISPKNPLWDLKLEGTGFSVESGIVYRITEKLKFFIGINYLSANIFLDRIVVDKKSYTLKDLGLSKNKANVNMNGMNFKIDVSIILTDPLQFEG